MQPERMISSERVFDGRIVRVRADAILLPNGRNATREVVEHRASAVVVPIDADGNAILVRQYRYPAEQVLLEAPAGVVEESETVIHLGSGALDHAHGGDEAAREAATADGKVVDRSLGLRSVVSAIRDLHFPHRVLLDPKGLGITHERSSA